MNHVPYSRWRFLLKSNLQRHRPAKKAKIEALLLSDARSESPLAPSYDAPLTGMQDPGVLDDHLLDERQQATDLTAAPYSNEDIVHRGDFMPTEPLLATERIFAPTQFDKSPEVEAATFQQHPVGPDGEKCTNKVPCDISDRPPEQADHALQFHSAARQATETGDDRENIKARRGVRFVSAIDDSEDECPGQGSESASTSESEQGGIPLLRSSDREMSSQAAASALGPYGSSTQASQTCLGQVSESVGATAQTDRRITSHSAPLVRFQPTSTTEQEYNSQLALLTGAPHAFRSPRGLGSTSTTAQGVRRCILVQRGRGPAHFRVCWAPYTSPKPYRALPPRVQGLSSLCGSPCPA